MALNSLQERVEKIESSTSTIPTNIISLIYCSHQILYNIQVESCSSVITTNIVF
jgi:hypothetical protein